MTLTVGSLFSGIGGLDLGLERAGMTVRWQSEVDPYACRVLAKHWPDVPNLGDVTRVDWSTVERVDLICGGYPCQPFSLAGARGGENDPRHLWPHFARALRELRPRWALLENVPGHLSLGFGRVLGDLAQLGFDAEWDCIPAAAVGAPHLRYRVFIVAYASGDARRFGYRNGAVNAHAHGDSEPGDAVDAFARSEVLVPDALGHELRQQPVALRRGGSATGPGDDGEERAVANADGEGVIGRRKRYPTSSEEPRYVADAAGSGLSDIQGGGTNGERSGLGTVDDAGWWNVEPDVGRVAHGIPARMDRLRALGNAVVPQVAEWVGRRIMEAAA